MLPKQEGGTTTEKLIAKLCDSTFLSLWAHPTPFYKKGGERGQTDELCDLLAVFGNDMIILSDKTVEYPITADERLNWQRWYRKAVDKSRSQILRAERLLRNPSIRVCADRQCRFPIPQAISTDLKMRVHRIAVASQALKNPAPPQDERRRLVIAPGVSGRTHTNDSCQPFYVGDVNPGAGFVHVFDIIGFSIILEHLDTAPDLIKYLTNREAFIKSGRLLGAVKEEDILAIYLDWLRDNEDDPFSAIPGSRPLEIKAAQWERYLESNDYRVWQQEVSDSLEWDRTIHAGAESFRNDKLVAPVGIDDGSTLERGLRYMAREPRKARIRLGRLMKGFFESPRPQDTVRVELRRSSTYRDTVFAFLRVPQLKDVDQIDEASWRQAQALEVCDGAKNVFPDAEHFVAITCEDDNAGKNSRTISVSHCAEWTEEQWRRSKEIGKNWHLTPATPYELEVSPPSPV